MNDIETLKTLLDAALEAERSREFLLETLIKLVGGVSYITPDGLYKEVNSEYAKICGYVPVELIGKAWTETVHPDDLPQAMEAYHKMLEKGNSDLVFRGITKNGDTFTKQIKLIKKVDNKGQLIGHYCFMEQIHD